MDPLDAWRDLIERLPRERAALPYANSDLVSKVVFDRERDSDLLVEVGWRGSERLHGIHLRLDIIEGRIWIRYDGAEHGIANDLVAAGVPESGVVLGFEPPKWRPFTEFAA